MKDHIIQLYILIVMVLIFGDSVSSKQCIPRKYEYSSMVCVCNSTYCDDIDQIKTMSKSNFVAYCSSMDGLRFKRRAGKLNTKKIVENKPFWMHILPFFTNKITLTIHRDEQLQKIIGFGGGFTDSSGITLQKMSNKLQTMIMDAYFGDNGLEYNLCRVPIAGTDFSTHPYSYNMEPENDIELSNFSLTMEDYKYKIPYIQQALHMSTENLYLIASAWSPPKWMKTNNGFTGSSQLFLKYYQTWANYHLKFLEEYKKHNISFWGITTGNEPSTGIVTLVKINSLGWLPENQALWIANNFGPSLKNSEFKDIKIIGIDDYRNTLPWWLNKIAENKEAMKYLDGIGTHWYMDHFLSPDYQEGVHELYPDLFILSTEACIGFEPWLREHVQLGSWENGESYMSSIIRNFGNWYSGWIEWNFVLDKSGGPNWFGNFVDAPIIALPESEEFLKQPMFYIIAHLSKFIPRDSIKINATIENGDVEYMAFLRPDNGITVILYNPKNGTRNVRVKEDGKGYIDIVMPRRSVVSVVYW